MLLRQPESIVFDLAYGGAIAALIGIWVLWDRRLRRLWKQARSKNWLRVESKLCDGEMITMRRARSETIAGYEVWFTYEYTSHGEREGIYRTVEFKTEEKAADVLKKLEGKSIQVRVKPDNPSKSLVCDEDLKDLLVPRVNA